MVVCSALSPPLPGEGRSRAGGSGRGGSREGGGPGEGGAGSGEGCLGGGIREGRCWEEGVREGERGVRGMVGQEIQKRLQKLPGKNSPNRTISGGQFNTAKVEASSRGPSHLQGCRGTGMGELVLQVRGGEQGIQRSTPKWKQQGEDLVDVLFH